MSDLMALTISHLCLSALPRRERSAYHCSACASLSLRPGLLGLLAHHHAQWADGAQPDRLGKLAVLRINRAFMEHMKARRKGLADEREAAAKRASEEAAVLRGGCRALSGSE